MKQLIDLLYSDEDIRNSVNLYIAPIKHYNSNTSIQKYEYSDEEFYDIKEEIYDLIIQKYNKNLKKIKKASSTWKDLENFMVSEISHIET